MILPLQRTAHSLQNLHSLFTRQAVADYPLFDFGEDQGKTMIEMVLRGLQAPEVHTGRKEPI